MTFRFGLGPVFAYEWLVASRRWQTYAMRSCLILCLGTGLAVVWYSHVRDLALSLSASASVGESFFYALVGTQLSLLLIAAPAATAGAVCHDKRSGALVQLLTTDLSNTEIILGKLAARLLPILALLLASAPLLFGAFLLGGIPEEALVGAYLVQFGIALLGCSLALTLSVWSKKTHEVLLVVYLVWIVVGLGAIVARLGPVSLPPWLSVILDDINPYVMAFSPYLRGGAFVLDQQIYFFVVCLGLSATLLVVAIVRVRAATLGQWGQPDKPLRDRPAPRDARRWLWPRLDPNPVLWREWHRRRPSRWIRGVWLAYAILAMGSSLAALAMSGPAGETLPGWVSGVQVLVGLLLSGVTSVTSLAEERLCGSLDVLLTTPLSTGQIVLGKWLASFRTVLLLAILPTSVAAMLGLRKLDFLPAVLVFLAIVSAGAVFVGLGLLLAAWSGRQSRALMMFVGLYLPAMLGPFLVLLLRLVRWEIAETIAIGGPWLNVTALTICIGDRPRNNFGIGLHGWALLYIGIYMLILLWLYRRMLATFDRCLGRVTKRSSGASRQELPGESWTGEFQSVTPVA